MAPFQVPFLKKAKYDNWIIKMKALLGANNTWDIIENGYDELEDETTLSQIQKRCSQGFKKERQEGFLFIFQALNDDGFEKLSKAKNLRKHEIFFKHLIREWNR